MSAVDGVGEVCPICRETITLGEEVAYMDGWHHKKCLDDYFAWRIELPLD